MPVFVNSFDNQRIGKIAWKRENFACFKVLPESDFSSARKSVRKCPKPSLFSSKTAKMTEIVTIFAKTVTFSVNNKKAVPPDSLQKTNYFSNLLAAQPPSFMWELVSVAKPSGDSKGICSLRIVSLLSLKSFAQYSAPAFFRSSR